MLIGPMQSQITWERFGGAAGNRTRVQSAYYVRVYPHSSAEAGRVEYRVRRARREGSRPLWRSWARRAAPVGAGVGGPGKRLRAVAFHEASAGLQQHFVGGGLAGKVRTLWERGVETGVVA